MAKADWNISTTGSWAVTTDEYVSSGHSIKGVSGQSKFLYNGNLSLLDSRIVGQVKCTGNLQTGGSALVGGGFLARATSVVAPLNLYIVTLRGYTANQYYFSFVRYKAGVYTLLCNLPYILPVPGTGLTNWHQFRLSVTDEFSMSVLRLEYFNSPDWVMVYAYDDDSVNRLSAVGGSGFYLSTGFDNRLYMDDVNVYSLT